MPAVGEQLIEAVVRVGTDAREQIAEIGKGFDVEALATGDEGTQDGRGSSPLSLLR